MSGRGDIPDVVPCVCNGVRGELLVREGKVRYEADGEVHMVEPSKFETSCTGRASGKKWKSSIRVVGMGADNMELGRYLREQLGVDIVRGVFTDAPPPPKPRAPAAPSPKPKAGHVAPRAPSARVSGARERELRAHFAAVRVGYEEPTAAPRVGPDGGQLPTTYPITLSCCWRLPGGSDGDDGDDEARRGWGQENAAPVPVHEEQLQRRQQQPEGQHSAVAMPSTYDGGESPQARGLVGADAGPARTAGEAGSGAAAAGGTDVEMAFDADDDMTAPDAAASPRPSSSHPEGASTGGRTAPQYGSSGVRAPGRPDQESGPNAADVSGAERPGATCNRADSRSGGELHEAAAAAGAPPAAFGAPCAPQEVEVVQGRAAHNGHTVLDVSALTASQLMELSQRSGSESAFETCLLRRSEEEQPGVRLSKLAFHSDYVPPDIERRRRKMREAARAKAAAAPADRPRTPADGLAKMTLAHPQDVAATSAEQLDAHVEPRYR